MYIAGLDLTIPAPWEYLGTVLRMRHVVHVHVPPPTLPSPAVRNLCCAVLRTRRGTPQLDASSLDGLQSANTIFIQLADFLECGREFKGGALLRGASPVFVALDFAAFSCFTKVFVQCASVSQNGCRSSASIQLVASGRDLSSLKIVDRSRADQLVASGLGPSPPLSSGFPRVSPAAAPGRREVRAGARLQPKLSKLPPLVPGIVCARRLTALDD